MKTPFLEALQSRVLLGDGAMGTQLQQAGLEPGGCGDEWNLSRPERVLAIQQRYADAGSDCVITNTFGSNRFVLGRYDLEERVFDINRAGAEIARRAVGPDRYVLGDIGPFGGMLEPLGETTREELVAAFLEQVRGLAAGGVDALIIETMTALEEIEAAVEAARTAAPGLPVIVSLAYDRLKGGGYKTMMGISPEAALQTLLALDVDVPAANCGTGLGIGDYQAIVATYRTATGKPVMAQPNGGMPELRDEQILYHETPAMMAAEVAQLVRAGARVVGGCCGTTPEHIALFRRELDRL